MKGRRGLIIPIILLGVVPFVFSFCSQLNTDEPPKFSIWLTDSPSDYAEVNIDIANVEIHVSSGSEIGWQTLSTVNAGVYNLLDLTNSRDKLIASGELSEVRISQVRLILGENNSLKLKDGTTITDLKIPSGQETGLKLIVDINLVAGMNYNLCIDFDAAKSIVEKGNGKYSLKPTMRAFYLSNTGAIKGIITPIKAFPNIQAKKGNETISTYPDPEGRFVLRGLDPGTYDIVFIPTTGYKELLRKDVVVTILKVTDIQTVTIPRNP